MSFVDGVIRLIGERVVLREFSGDDESAVHSYASDPVVTRFTDWGPNSIEDTQAFLGEAMAQASTSPRVTFALAAIDTASQALVGCAALAVTNVEHRRGEIGFVIHPDSWSRGLSTEAAQVLLQFGFDQLRLQRISATCHPDNHASSKVLQKAGLLYEGRMRSHLFVRGAWRDSLLYAAIDGDAAPTGVADQ
jgi:ribosomal-protein-alanine N-acetyltransferase